MLLDLPHDVLSYIFRKLRLHEIGNILRTCSFLNSSVTNDKQLWLHILKRDIKYKALPLPKCIRNIEASTAQDVIRRVKSSILIDKGYSSGENKTLIRENLSMSVTWIKLVWGRWCLIACSDLRVSQLVVWDLQASQDERHKATFYLPGPIVDGVVEDNKDEILIALTIGTKIASISILELYTDGNEVFIHQLVEVPGASHVRLLKRPYIGFAVRDGDDTSPSILNWETRCLRSFVTPDPEGDLCINLDDDGPYAIYNNSHAPCHGMFIWRGRVILLYPGKIVVFGNSGNFDQFSDEILLSSQCIRVHYLGGAYADVFVLNYEDHPTANGLQDTLRLILHAGTGSVARLFIRYDEASDAPGKLVFDGFPGCLELPILEDKYESEVTNMAVGPTYGQILTLAVIQHNSWPMPTLYVSQLNPSEESVTFGPAIPLSTDGMLLLFDVTCMDFDDGIGLFVVGTHRGEVCIRTFGAILPSSSLNSDLPLLQASPDFKTRIALDLPTIYEVHSSVSSQDSRQKLIEEAFRAWGSTAPSPHLPGWSSDWSQFQNIDQWVTPFPRWGMFDDIVDEDKLISTRIRWRLGTLGEIIPVLFDESNHYRVLFRVGDWLHFCKSKNKDPLANIDEEFEDAHDDIIGIFPITFTQSLETSPITIAELIDDPWMRSNFVYDYTSYGARSMVGHNWVFNSVKEALVKQRGEYPGDKVLEAWSSEEWAAMRKSVGLDVILRDGAGEPL